MAGLFAPTIEVNDEVIPVKPNSVSYKDGFGETKLRVTSSGGGATSQVDTQDVSTKMGMIKFTVLSTADLLNKVRAWQANGSANVVKMSDVDITRTFQLATIVNDPEKALGVDGEVEVEFHTRPAV